MRGRDRLAQVRDQLARWRAEHGGRGIRVPEAMWAEVVEVAEVLVEEVVVVMDMEGEATHR